MTTFTEDDIEKVMDGFDFQRARCVMNKLNQHWAQSYPDSPSVEQLRENARMLLKGVLEGGIGSTHLCGRFRAHMSKDALELEYIALDSEYYGNDDDE